MRFKVKIRIKDGSSVVRYYNFGDVNKAFKKGGIMHKYDNWCKEHPNEPCPEELLFLDKLENKSLFGILGRKFFQ